MRRFSFVVLLILLATLSVNRASARAGADARDKLLAFQREVKTLSADFRQVVSDETGAVIQDSAGTVVLARPLRFRWDYRTPFEQLIVSDGDTLWFYDADLEQVTVKVVGENLDNSAALVLSAKRPIEETFELESMSSRDGLDWVRAKPRDMTGTFQAIEIGFKGRDLGMMVLHDNFGQTTRLEFADVRRNPRVSDTEFRFVVPFGVDIMRSGD
jgi:outer membrane lipoprotein carrier protein